MPPPSEAVCRFHCPPCPSTNNLYLTARASGKRVKAPAYRAWLSEAGWLVKLQRPQAVAGRVRALVEAPFSLRRDLDNIKAVLDLAVGLCLIDDDSCIDDLRVVRTPTGEEMRVTIWPIGSAPPS